MAGAASGSEISLAKLKRGSLSKAEFVASSIMMTGNKRMLKRLAKANCFDVVGGAPPPHSDSPRRGVLFAPLRLYRPTGPLPTP